MIAEQIVELRTLAAGGALQLKATPSGKYHNYDPVKENAVKIAELEKKLEKEKRKAAVELARVTKVINAITDGVEHEILTLRYVKCMKWEEIAEETNYSEQRLYQLHNSGLKNLKIRVN